jgi:hypothetical protein
MFRDVMSEGRIRVHGITLCAVMGNSTPSPGAAFLQTNDVATLDEIE